MLKLGAAVMRGIALGLKLPETYFDQVLILLSLKLTSPFSRIASLVLTRFPFLCIPFCIRVPGWMVQRHTNKHAM